ncbi:odorant receptor 67d-like [Stomoxys calcitrans]|uniref:Odorant receptor n=1 Tax=Stomoxys calcitrans TaxID=35570 RepID=D7R4I5_STOCA|nr:odorant receptor 67d-like [Stomoxys calcitrans]ADG96063.1 putative odorant receptor [Stomoxys calcitrans]
MARPTIIKSPSQRFKKFLDVIKLFAKTCGANIFAEDYRINALTCLITILVNCFMLFNFYTIYVSVAKDNYHIVLQNLCVVGTAIQGFSKLINAIVYQDLTRFTCSEIEFMYRTFETEEQHYVDVLNTSLKLLKRIIFTILKIYGILTIAILISPMIIQMITNERLFILNVFIPGVDVDTTVGFIIIQTFNAACTTFSGFGNFAADTACFMLGAHTPLMKDIIKCKLIDLDEVLRKHPKDRSRTEPLVKDIIQWHQRYIIFTEKNTSNFFWMIFIQVASSVMGIISNMVCMFLGGWPVAPLYLLSSFVILFCYCSLGNLVELSNEDMCDNIYECKWYELTVPEQKMILIMLRESQKPNNLSVGGVASLSMNTGLQLTKSIYSVAMLLNNSLN